MRYVLSVYQGCDAGEFLAAAGRAGELVDVQVFADPALSSVVRDGGVGDGPYLRDAEQVACQYVVDCDGRERAVALAALISGGRGVEVRPLMASAGLEM
ncbi:YciI family protein [Actinocorallia lasiicapitis]